MCVCPHVCVCVCLCVCVCVCVCVCFCVDKFCFDITIVSLILTSMSVPPEIQKYRLECRCLVFDTKLLVVQLNKAGGAEVGESWRVLPLSCTVSVKYPY